MVDRAQVETLLEALEAKAMEAMDADDMALSAALMKALDDLEKWLKSGMPEPAPVAPAQLEAWGLPVPEGWASSEPMEEEETPTISRESVERLVEGLKRKSVAAVEEDDMALSSEVMRAWADVQRWLKGGMTGPLPLDSGKLQEWGISIPEGLSLPDAGRPELPFVELSGTDPDDELEARYQEGLVALNLGDYARAKRAFDDVRKRARGRLRAPAKISWEEAATRQREKERELLQAARGTAEKFPGDFAKQREAWRALLTFAEKDSEAQAEARAALEQIEQAQQHTERLDEVRAKLATLKRQVDDAYRMKQLTTLNGLIVDTQGLGDAGIPAEIVEDWEGLLSNAKTLLDRLKDETGVLRTYIEDRDREEAVAKIQRHIDEGTREVWDPKINKTRPIDELYEEAVRNLAEFRKRKAIDRQSKAQAALKKGFPRTAVEYYQEAIDFLTYLHLKPERDDGVERIIKEGSLPKLHGEDLVERERENLQGDLDQARELLGQMG